MIRTRAIIMVDILHNFYIKASPERVFEAISMPDGVSEWWSFSTMGDPVLGSVYELDFGPGYQWRAKVVACAVPTEFEWEMIEAENDWVGSRIGFSLEGDEDKTLVRFHHAGWAEANEHFRRSSYCWAMYMRILKRFVEDGERVPYADRLNV